MYIPYTYYTPANKISTVYNVVSARELENRDFSSFGKDEISVIVSC